MINATTHTELWQKNPFPWEVIGLSSDTDLRDLPADLITFSAENSWSKFSPLVQANIS